MTVYLGQIPTKPRLCPDDPEKAKAAVFEMLGYKIYAKEVKDFHESKAKIRIPIAPARTSKSYSAYPEVIYHGMPTIPLTTNLTWIVGTDYPTNKEFQYVFEAVVEKREQWPFHYTIAQAHNTPSQGNMRIVVEWGKDKRGMHRWIVEGKSATNEKSLLGEQVPVAVLSEAAQHERRIWEKYLSTRYGLAIMPTTPNSKALWLQEMCEMSTRDSSLGIEVFEYPTHANPYYDKQNYEMAKRQASIRTQGHPEDDPWFAEQFLGRWVFYTGKVLPFDKSRHWIDPGAFDLTGCDVMVSVDYGYEDESVALFWAVHPSGIYVIFDEIYEQHLTTPEFVGRIQKRLDERKLTARYVTGDPSQPQVARVMGDAGMHVFPMDKNAQRDRAAGFRRLVDLLTEGPLQGFPGIYLTSDCPKTANEWNHLRFKENYRNEYANGSFSGADHAADAARYFVMTRSQPKPPVEESDWLRAAVQNRESRGESNSFLASIGQVGAPTYA